MKYEALALVLFCAVAFGGLGYLFVTITDGVNQPAGSSASTRPAAVEQGAPPAGPVVEEEAPIVLGSPSITTNQARDEVVVDFFECIPGSGSLDFDAGTVQFVMAGLEGNDCVIHYTVGDNDVICYVPSGVGVRRFSITDEVPDLGSIQTYCEAS